MVTRDFAQSLYSRLNQVATTPNRRFQMPKDVAPYIPSSRRSSRDHAASGTGSPEGTKRAPWRLANENFYLPPLKLGPTGQPSDRATDPDRMHPTSVLAEHTAPRLFLLVAIIGHSYPHRLIPSVQVADKIVPRPAIIQPLLRPTTSASVTFAGGRLSMCVFDARPPAILVGRNLFIGIDCQRVPKCLKPLHRAFTALGFSHQLGVPAETAVSQVGASNPNSAGTRSAKTVILGVEDSPAGSLTNPEPCKPLQVFQSRRIRRVSVNSHNNSELATAVAKCPQLFDRRAVRGPSNSYVHRIGLAQPSVELTKNLFTYYDRHIVASLVTWQITA